MFEAFLSDKLQEANSIYHVVLASELDGDGYVYIPQGWTRWSLSADIALVGCISLRHNENTNYSATAEARMQRSPLAQNPPDRHITLH